MITGATGLLGKALLNTIQCELIPCSSRHYDGWETFDITNRDETIAAIKRRSPDTIIHCAAIGSVDKVQLDFVSGLAVNLNGTCNVIDGARAVGARLVMVSTNAVFDGRDPLYVEDAHLCPVSNYGIIKAAAELAVRASGLDWIVVRPILMYGNHNPAQRGNWVTIWVEKLRRGEVCPVVFDVNTQPLYNYDCAEVIRLVMAKDMWGNVFNVGGGDRLTLFEFARSVAQTYGFDPGLIKPVPSSYFPNIAPRPRDTSYNLDKIRSLGHVPVSIIDGLRLMREEANHD